VAFQARTTFFTNQKFPSMSGLHETRWLE